MTKPDFKLKLYFFLIFLLPLKGLWAYERDSVFTKDVVVTGSLKELLKEEFAIPIQIYDGAYFQRQQITNVQDALRMITGIQSNIDGALDGAGDIEFNGQEGSYTLVMLDGVPISGGNATVYAISGIPLSIIERIEVMQGPASTVYGTDAVAGVINIITKNVERAPSFFVEAGVNSLLESNVEMGFKVKAGKADGLFAVSNYNQSYKWDLNKDSYMDVLLQNRFSLFNKWSVRGKYSKQSSFWLRYTNDRRGSGEMDWSKKYEGSDYIYGEAIKVNRVEAAGNYALPLASEKLNLIFSYTWQGQNSFYGFNQFDSKEQNALVQMVYDKRITARSDLMAGVGYRMYWYDDNQSGTAVDTSLTARNKPFVNHMPSFFLQDMVHLNAQNELLAGVRFEFTSINNDFAICPRIDYKWSSLNKKHSVRIGFGSGFRTPNLFVDDRIGYSQGRKIVFADKVKNELSYGGHVHYDLTKVVKQTVVKFDSRIFTNYIINVVEAELADDNSTLVIENEGSQTFYYGAQANVEARFRKGFYARLGFTLQQSYEIEDEDGEKQYQSLVNSPIFNVVYDFGYENKDNGWTASVYGWLNSPLLMRRQFNDTRPEFSPWYGWLNCNVQKTFKNNLSIRVGVNNILNLRPKNIFVRAHDPFNYTASNRVDNPRGLLFDTTYLYAANKGAHAFLTIIYTLK